MSQQQRKTFRSKSLPEELHNNFAFKILCVFNIDDEVWKAIRNWYCYFDIYKRRATNKIVRANEIMSLSTFFPFIFFYSMPLFHSDQQSEPVYDQWSQFARTIC